MQGAPDAVANHVGKDKWTLVMVWSTACVTCRMETPAVDAYYQANSKGRVRVLGVAINGHARKKAIEGFRADYGMSFPTLVADPSQYLGHFKAQTGRPFSGTPTFLLYSPAGELSGINVGAINLEKLDAFIASQPG
jgi:thiol-disulfide isomerase/thioredoxin